MQCESSGAASRQFWQATIAPRRAAARNTSSYSARFSDSNAIRSPRATPPREHRGEPLRAVVELAIASAGWAPLRPSLELPQSSIAMRSGCRRTCDEEQTADRADRSARDVFTSHHALTLPDFGCVGLGDGR